MESLLDQGTHLFAARLAVLDSLLKARGINARRTCSYRSPHEQARLYLQGRSTPGAIVTDARAGKSPHNWGQPAHGTIPALSLAADYAPLINGVVTWEPGSAWWQAFGQAARDSKLYWGGLFRHRPDRPHVELPNWEHYTKGPR